MPTDQELLRRFAAERDEAALAELLRRYLDIVYAAALRRTDGRHALAQEITQEVFTQVARKAAALASHPAFAGWLHRCTRYAAIDALRTEARRHKLAKTLQTMTDPAAPPAAPPDWEQLRPLLDQALDRLKSRDRALMMLRYFRGLTFREIGAELGLTENAARMRTERALDALRDHLVRQGVTSTSAALGLLLANQPAVAAPSGLAAALTATALATAPAGVTTTVTSFLLMSKLTAPALAAIATAGLTALVWTSTVRGTTTAELAALRAENARLNAATAAGAPAAATAAVADEFAAQADAIARVVDRRRAAGAASHDPTVAAPLTTPHGHRDHGQATARDAMFSFAWATDAGEIGSLARLLCFDGAGREKALAVHAAMPTAVRAEYATPEELYAFFLVADALLYPPPDAAYMELCDVVDAGPGRVSLLRPGGKPDRWHQYLQTSAGWKFVIPEAAVDRMPQVLNADTLSALSGP